MDIWENLSKAELLKQQKEETLQNFMGFVNSEWKDFEDQLISSKACLTEWFSEEGLKSDEESIRAKWVDKGYKILNGVAEKIEIERGLFEKIQDSVDEKMKYLVFQEEQIKGLCERDKREFRSLVKCLEEREIQVESKESLLQERENELIEKVQDVERREKELSSREEMGNELCLEKDVLRRWKDELRLNKEKLGRTKNELDCKMIMLNKREAALDSRGRTLERKEYELASQGELLKTWKARLQSAMAEIARKKDELSQREK
ncbi:OLC1v1000654C1 [Oldenlandia corymbosa var. corymbosa]|uniref:OLC1v1000654C1 n=1 Tax=Oldenlandia corymbosa var. corymbosa TaxID=529605 RepID=A0AAV1D6E8_OLDCO|nr:OLC1v1000654C1 [Oldenlandia corymbosa var. corymbosa]